MDQQQIFNQVVEHLARQKEAAVGASGQCALRGSNGTRCAIGLLIPDADYVEEMEKDSGISVFTGMNPETAQEPKPTTHFWLAKNLQPTEQDWRFLQVIQDAHDLGSLGFDKEAPARRERARYKWPDALQMVASEHGLSLDVQQFQRNLNDAAYCH